MNAPFKINSFTSVFRPVPVVYHSGEHNRCPECGCTEWLVGRQSAECKHCDHPLPLAHLIK